MTRILSHAGVGIGGLAAGFLPAAAASSRKIGAPRLMAEEVGRKIASGEEARRLLKIGVWYDTVEETLLNLGLPPNRAKGQTGSVLYPTDGKLPAQRPLGSDGHPLAGDMARAAASV